MKKTHFESSYDAVVIGSGIGGLTTASILAQSRGAKVLMLEAHYTAGGYTHTYTRKGYEWDVGVHYVGWLQNPNHPFTRVLDYVTDGNLHWQDMGDVYDRIIFPDQQYEFHKGEGPFIDNLSRHFPHERDNLKRYMDIVRKIEREIPYFCADRILPKALGKLAKAHLSPTIHHYMKMTATEALRTLFNDEKLISVISGTWGTYNMAPGEVSFLMQAIITAHFRDGGSFPIGGPSQIAKTVEEVLKKSGGQIVTSARVSEILCRQGRAYGVRLEDGQEIQSPIIVSNAGLINTYRDLLPQDIRERLGLARRLQLVKSTPSLIQVLIGLKKSGEELNLQKTNIWIHRQYDHDESIARTRSNIQEDRSVIFGTFPSMKDPDWNRRHPGRSTISLISEVDYSLFERWENQEWRNRGPEYEEIKKEMGQRLIERFTRFVPQIKNEIDYFEVGTPLTAKTFCLSPYGEPYGLAHDPSRFMQDWIQPNTEIEGLYLTGADVSFLGLGGAVVGGVFAAMKILGPIEGRSILMMMAPWKW